MDTWWEPQRVLHLAERSFGWTLCISARQQHFGHRYGDGQGGVIRTHLASCPCFPPCTSAETASDFRTAPRAAWGDSGSNEGHFSLMVLVPIRWNLINGSLQSGLSKTKQQTGQDDWILPGIRGSALLLLLFSLPCALRHPVEVTERAV